ncbi:MAG: hypothetical protein ACREL5_01280 [Gemmatimonadales bacterium]
MPLLSGVRVSLRFTPLTLAAVVAAAQAPVAPGAVVRWFDVDSRSEVQGTVRSVSADSMTVVIGPGERWVAIRPVSIRSLEWRHGRRGGWHGAALGAIIGAGAFAVLGYAAGQDCNAPGAAWVCFSRTSLGAVLAIPGALIGGLVGAATYHPWQWRSVNDGESSPQAVVESLVTWRHHAVVVGLNVRF